MNIYIYGNEKFKKDIHTTLNNANIQFKLDNNTLIKNIDTLEELEDTIKSDPNHIYLIDDEKIIKKNSKIKFLNPKDGIEESFLLDHGIADLSVNSLNEIPKYILRKYEEQSDNSHIHDSIVDIVDEAFEKNKEEDSQDENFELDEELSLLLAKEEDSSKEENLSKDEEKEEHISIDAKELEKEENFKEDVGLSNVSSDYDEKVEDIKEDSVEIKEEDETLEDIGEDLLSGFETDEGIPNFEITSNEDEDDDLDDLLAELGDENFANIDIIKDEDYDLKEEEKNGEEKLPVQGENMSDEFSELDGLSEKEVKIALNLEDEEEKSQIEEISSKENMVSVLDKKSEVMDIESTNAGELSNLITKLIKNKTLEITIKIKD